MYKSVEEPVQENKNKGNAVLETRAYRSMLLILIAVMLTVLAMLRITLIMGVFPQVHHSTYMYAEYNTQQKALRNKLYKLTPDSLKIVCDTKLTEYEASTVITDYLLYDPYSYWLQPDYTLTVSDGVLYLNCKTDYTTEQRKEIDSELTERINKVVADAKAQKDNGIKAMYAAIYEHLYDIELTDGTFRAPIRCCLLDRACNCQGLAYTFLYLCERTGLQASLQYGNYYGEKCVGWTVDSNALADGTYVIDRSNAGHVWNVVVLEHELYYIDIYAQIDDAEKDLRFLTAAEMKNTYYLWDENVAQQLQGVFPKTVSTMRVSIIAGVLLVLLLICCLLCLGTSDAVKVHSNDTTDTYNSIL